MNISTEPGEKILGVAIEEIPLQCRTCPRLARFALMYPGLDLTTQNAYPEPSNRAHRVAREVMSRMGNVCPGGVDANGDCGSTV